jgi:hypothetical protein
MVVPEPITGEKAHVSAWLDNSRTDIQKVFRCNACGAPMFKYYDSLQVIVPGIVDTGQNPIVIQCKGRYEFISILGRPVSAVCKVNYWIYR